MKGRINAQKGMLRAMPGRFFLTTPLSDIAAAFSASPDLPETGERLDAAPGEEVAAIISDSGGRRLVPMRWGMIPMGRTNARGRPVMETIVNARSETLFQKSAFEGVRRAILPVNGWYEWTGEKRRKTRWAISDPASPILAFAAIWDVWAAPGGREIASLATVTVAPNEDVAPIHHRMAVILAPEDWAAWLGETDGDLKAMFRPWPIGRLKIVESDLK